MTARGLLISAPRSGSGKTTVTLGLLAALKRRGMRVRAAKAGPDFIDPAFHAAATGRGSVNLDSWAMQPALLDALMMEASAADIVVIEGAMGLFDGVEGEKGRTGASADLAARYRLPVVLVLDVTAQAQSAAVVARGFMTHDPDVHIGGVILNKVGSPRHARLAGDAVATLGLPVLGAIPRDAALILPERHLGLVQAGEHGNLAVRLAQLADMAEAHLDLDAITALAAPLAPQSGDASSALPPRGQRIALAQDAAFSFIYPHLIDGWRKAGAEIVPFSPLANEAPPDDCDVCWLPGGYPELHAGGIAAADRFRAGLTRFATTRPVHGECGGYMVLGGALTDADGVRHEMAGLLGLETSYAKRRMHLGYRLAELAAPMPGHGAGARLRGHEFHYSTIVAQPDTPLGTVRDATGAVVTETGSRRGHVTGTFFHLIAEDR